MKKLLSKAAVFTGIIVLFATFKLSAQAPTGPYAITNQNTYNFGMRWIMENSSCSTACAISTGLLNFSSGSTITIPLSTFNSCGGGPACNVIVKIFDACGTQVIQVDRYTPSVSASGTDCNGVAYSFTLTWTSTGTTLQ